jgi:hypothetical protein
VSIFGQAFILGTPCSSRVIVLFKHTYILQCTRGEVLSSYTHSLRVRGILHLTNKHNFLTILQGIRAKSLLSFRLFLRGQIHWYYCTLCSQTKCEHIEATDFSVQTQFLQIFWISNNKIYAKINIFNTLTLKIVK